MTVRFYYVAVRMRSCSRKRLRTAGSRVRGLRRVSRVRHDFLFGSVPGRSAHRVLVLRAVFAAALVVAAWLSRLAAWSSYSPGCDRWANPPYDTCCRNCPGPHTGPCDIRTTWVAYPLMAEAVMRDAPAFPPALGLEEHRYLYKVSASTQTDDGNFINYFWHKRSSIAVCKTTPMLKSFTIMTDAITR